MELKDLRKLPMPKLRDLAKQETELTGVGGMQKEELIKAIAQAKGIAYDESSKDLNAKKLKRVKRKIKLLKRLTRHLAHEAKISAGAKGGEAPAAG